MRVIDQTHLRTRERACGRRRWLARGRARGARFALCWSVCGLVLLASGASDARVVLPGSATWSVTTAPVLSQNPPPEDFLPGVSCTSGRACVAVGTDVNELVATRWDGTRWISQRIANP